MSSQLPSYNTSAHLTHLQAFVCPGEAHGLEALEVGHLSLRPGHASAVRVCDAGGEGFDVPLRQGEVSLGGPHVTLPSNQAGKKRENK